MLHMCVCVCVSLSLSLSLSLPVRLPVVLCHPESGASIVIVASGRCEGPMIQLTIPRKLKRDGVFSCLGF